MVVVSLTCFPEKLAPCEHQLLVRRYDRKRHLRVTPAHWLLFKAVLRTIVAPNKEVPHMDSSGNPRFGYNGILAEGQMGKPQVRCLMPLIYLTFLPYFLLPSCTVGCLLFV